MLGQDLVPPTLTEQKGRVTELDSPTFGTLVEQVECYSDFALTRDLRLEGYCRTRDDRRKAS